jgi:SAM-dependent methyltransferase
MMNDEVSYQDFEKYFPFAPTALCVKECARLAALRAYQCEGPILDVGCGDGLFAKIAYGNAEVWGIDIDGAEGRHAQASRAYSHVILADVTRAWMPPSFFQTCIANCSLEHVPDIDGALTNILRAMRPGGRAYLFVPNRDWASHLTSVRALRALGAESMAASLQARVDRFFHHHHLYDEAGWRAIATRVGFEIVEVASVGSTASTAAFEAFLLPSLAGWLNKRMTTRWTNFPSARKTMAPIAFAAVRAALAASGDAQPTAEFLVVLRRPS